MTDAAGRRLLISGNRQGMSALGVFGRPAYRLYTQVRSLIAKRFGDAHARVLAEPVQSGADQRIDWYASLPGEAVAYGDLADPERVALDAELARILRDLREFASELEAQSGKQQEATLVRQASSYFGSEYVFAVGGRPVITFWGFEVDDPERARAGLIRTGALRAAPPPPEPTPLPGPTPAPLPEPLPPIIEPVERRSQWWLWALLLLALLLLLLWLRGCDDLLKGCHGPILVAATSTPTPTPTFVPIDGDHERATPAEEATATVAAELPTALPSPGGGGDGGEEHDNGGGEAPKDEPTPEITPGPGEGSDDGDNGTEPLPTRGPELVMPTNAPPSQAPDFVDGRWYSETELFSIQDKAPVVLRYDLDKSGGGTMTVLRQGKPECKAKVQASVDKNGNLRIKDPSGARCPGTSSFAPTDVQCKPGEDGKADCQILQKGLEPVPTRLRRGGPNDPEPRPAPADQPPIQPPAGPDGRGSGDTPGIAPRPKPPSGPPGGNWNPDGPADGDGTDDGDWE